jgi:hypothetical protein
MRSIAAMVLLAGVVVGLVNAGDAKYTVKAATTSPPSELAEPVKKLLADRSVQMLDGSGKTVAEFWFRPEVKADATPEQVKNGLSYREIPQSEILGAVRFDQDWSDYRKQKVKAGIYTLRLAYQPADGDHQGSSEFQDFILVTAADKDTKTDLVDFKEMVERSAKSLNTAHPGVFMLFPNSKPAQAPELVSRPRSHLYLSVAVTPIVQGKKMGTMGIGMTVVGHAE